MIGAFDSGLGGSLLINSIFKQTKADLLYIGDRKHHPYGTKSDAEIIAIFDEWMNLFRQRGINEIVIACNTLCSTIDFNAYPDLILYDIIERTAAQINVAKDANIVVCATPKTVEKGRYEKALNKRGYTNVQAIALEKLAVYVEQFADDEIVLEYLKEEMGSLKPDVIILACTHYPVYKHLFAKLFSCELVDSTSLTYDFKDLEGNQKLYIHMDQNEEVDRFLNKYVDREYTYD